jgi:hypothetical protein
MSLNRFDSMGELIEFVSFSTEVARGSEETAHLFEFVPTTTEEKESPQHVFWILGPQSKDARVDSFITNMALKSLQRGYMSPKDKLYFSTLVGFDLNSVNPEEKETKLLRTLDRWIKQIQPRCVITLKRGDSALSCHKLSDPIHDKLVEITEKKLLQTEMLSTEKTKPAGASLYDKILNLLITNDVSILELGLDAVPKSFEECAQSEWKLSTGPALRWMIESLPFKITAAPEMPVLEIIPPLEIPAEFGI